MLSGVWLPSARRAVASACAGRSRNVGVRVWGRAVCALQAAAAAATTTRSSCGAAGASPPAPQPLARAPLLTPEEKARFWQDGFVVLDSFIPPEEAVKVRERYDGLFAGQFDTGVFPDEWHWRAGLSFPDKPREIVNGWKSDSVVRGLALHSGIGALVSDLMGWRCGARIGQDSVVWKPPGAGVVRFHQDSPYISHQFDPRQDISATVWIALDAATEASGVVRYARGSHTWPIIPHTAAESSFHDGEDTGLRDAANHAGQDVADNLEVVQASVPLGGCVIHHQDTWHGSGPNTTAGTHRRALAVHCIRGDVRFVDNPTYIYGRYKTNGSAHVDPSFFPWMYKGEACGMDEAGKCDCLG